MCGLPLPSLYYILISGRALRLKDEGNNDNKFIFITSYEPSPRGDTSQLYGKSLDEFCSLLTTSLLVTRLLLFESPLSYFRVVTESENGSVEKDNEAADVRPFDLSLVSSPLPNSPQHIHPCGFVLSRNDYYKLWVNEQLYQLPSLSFSLYLYLYLSHCSSAFNSYFDVIFQSYDCPTLLRRSNKWITFFIRNFPVLRSSRTNGKLVARRKPVRFEGHARRFSIRSSKHSDRDRSLQSGSPRFLHLSGYQQ